MRKVCAVSTIALAATLLLSAAASAQDVAPQGGALANTKFSKLDAGPGGPAPKRDLNGSWAGPIAVDTSLKAPSMNPLGQKLFSANKSEPEYHVSGTNDSFSRNCDPLGFPRNTVFETRGIAFAAMAERTVLLNQYQRAWREIWTDGRSLPSNVGAAEKNALDPRYYGYSIGHWEGDYTFVIDTTGLDERTWLTRMGYPHSIDAHVQERYTRVDHNDLQMTVTVDDPKLYTKPFVLGTSSFKWIPDQQLDEQLCIPSEMLQYLSIIADPAGTGVPPVR